MLKKKAKEYGNIFKILLTEKFFRIALIIHLFYLILAITLTLVFFQEFNDFTVFYKAGEVSISNLGNLYNPSNYLWPFRYFPLGAFIFIPFALLPFGIAFILFNIFNFIINLFICVILYKIVRLNIKEEILKKKISFYLGLYLIALPHVYNYIMGQSNLLVAICLLISLFIFLKKENLKWNCLGGLFVGLGITVKPIAIFIIPFLISFTLFSSKKILFLEIKNSLVRIFGALLPLFLNVPLFLMFPELFHGFLEINFIGTDTLIVNNSFSITKLIINALSMYGVETSILKELQIIIFLVVFLLIGVTGFIIYLIRAPTTHSIIFGYILGIVIVLLVYFDSWDHHLLILIPFLLILIISFETLPDNNKPISFLLNVAKKSFYFFIFVDLPLFGLIFLIRNIFPFNFIPTIFLLLIYGSIERILINKGKNS